MKNINRKIIDFTEKIISIRVVSKIHSNYRPILRAMNCIYFCIILVCSIMGFFRLFNDDAVIDLLKHSFYWQNIKSVGIPYISLFILSFVMGIAFLGRKHILKIILISALFPFITSGSIISMYYNNAVAPLFAIMMLSIIFTSFSRFYLEWRLNKAGLLKTGIAVAIQREDIDNRETNN